MAGIPRKPSVDELSQAQIRKLSQIVFLSSDEGVSELLILFGENAGNWELCADYILKHSSVRVITTGYRDLETPDDIVPLSNFLSEELQKYGVPRKRIIQQANSTNTLEDALFTRELLNNMGLKPASISFGCSSHHSGRCYLTLKKVFPEAVLRALVMDYKEGLIRVGSDSWWQTASGRGLVCGEYLRIVKYSEKGDIAEPEGAADVSVFL